MRGKTKSKRFPKTSFSLSTSTNTFSKNVVLHENVLIPDMMASCSFPDNTKNNDLYLVRRRDLVKTNLNTSASYLDTNSRVKCSMHSSGVLLGFLSGLARRRSTFSKCTLTYGGNHCLQLHVSFLILSQLLRRWHRCLRVL